MNREQCQQLAGAVLSAPTIQEAADCVFAQLQKLAEAGAPNTRGSWRDYLNRFHAWLLRGAREDVPFSIFVQGNGKLPYWSFSALPGITCPGAGDCLEWCYSFRAWRYPAAFLRQLQNTFLLRNRRELVAEAFRQLPDNAIVRLYVDGDFSSVAEVHFWFALLIHERSDVRAYGYSKSWREILAWCFQTAGGDSERYPRNYVLNVSGGSCHDAQLREAVLKLPFARHVFEAVNIPGGDIPRGNARYDSREYHAQTREAYKEQTGQLPFSCPGKCGECRVSAGIHACGDISFQLPIAIGVH